MKQFILSVYILSFISCTDNVDDNIGTPVNSKTLTAWETNQLLGEVKLWQTETFDVSDYKFGEPVYVSQYQSTTLFNPYGYVQSSRSTYTSKYYNNNFEEEMVYLDEELGLIKERRYKNITDGKSNVFYQEFQYDSLNRRRQRTHRNLITNDEEFSKWDYQNEQERITDYDKNMNLLRVHIKKYDDYHNTISDVAYDEDGELKRGVYFSFERSELVKDSMVFQYSFGKYVNVNSYDWVGRLVYQESYELEDDGSISDFEGSFIEYDTNNLHTSHIIKKFKGDKSVILQKYKVEIKTDPVGNITEKIKINADTKRIVEKELFTYQYY